MTEAITWLQRYPLAIRTVFPEKRSNVAVELPTSADPVRLAEMVKIQRGSNNGLLGPVVCPQILEPKGVGGDIIPPAEPFQYCIGAQSVPIKRKEIELAQIGTIACAVNVDTGTPGIVDVIFGIGREMAPQPIVFDGGVIRVALFALCLGDAARQSQFAVKKALAIFTA